MAILTGLRVVEVSASGAAALAGKHFADWGATVTHLEPPGGTPLRTGPPLFGPEGAKQSAAWEWLVAGKQIAEVGSSAVGSPEEALAVCLDADLVLIESELAASVLGLQPGRLREAFAGHTSCVAITPFALDGPYAHYRATDLGINALGGWCNLIGDPGERPLRPGYDMIPRLEGISALVAGLLALRCSDAGGAPGFAEVSGQAVAATMIVAPWLMKSMLGIEQNRRANDWLQGGVMECNDGWFGCTPLTAAHWEMMCHMLGMADVLEEPGGLDPNWRWDHSAELLERARPALAQASKFELFAKAQSWRIPGAPVENVAERLACPQLAARGFFEPFDIAGNGAKVPRVPYRISSANPVRRGPPERLTERLPRERPSGVQRADEASPACPLPFTGVRVIDLTHFWAGPYATSMLGAFGADVIKVESVQRPDAFRYTFAPAQLDQWWERSPIWQDTNCDKRGITLDLGSIRGAEIFERLVAGADVVINNFSNRVMANLGFTDERLHGINPRLLMVSVPGYGSGGPWEDYVGFGLAFEQLAVCASITGYEGGVPRIMSGFCDPLSGMHAVAAIVLALRERERTGHGAVIQVPQCEVLDSLFAPEMLAVQGGAPVPRGRGNRHEWMAPHNTYRVAGEDRWLAIAVGSDREFQGLCRVLGSELTTDPRFHTSEGRKANEAELDALLEATFAGRDGGQLEADLQAAGVMAARVAKGWELPDDANLRHIGFFQAVDRALTGRHQYKTWPFRLDGVSGGHRRPAPLLGEHTAEVLTEIGISAPEIDELATEGVIGARPLGA